MTSELDYLRAVQAEPDAAEPRLRYADWLRSRRDARDDFIRLHVESERLQAGDPRRDEMRGQAFRILVANEDAWVLPIGEGLIHWSWRRGFVESVTLTGDAFVARAAGLFVWMPIREVRLFADKQHAPVLARCPQLAHVSPLDFDPPVIQEFDTTLGDAGLEALLASEHLTRLTALRVGNNKVGPRGGRALASAPALRRLHTLGLESAALGEAGFAELAGSEALASLRNLGLSWIKGAGGAKGLQALARSPYLGQLEHLDLSLTELSPAAWGALFQSRAFPRLNSLALGAVKLPGLVEMLV